MNWLPRFRMLTAVLLVATAFLASFVLFVRASSAGFVTPTVRYVAQGGVDDGNLCTDSANPCSTIQHGVDVAQAGDEIRIAAGMYAGLHGRPAPLGYEGPTVITQVVYLTKTLALRGGFSLDWSVQDPVRNPSVVDAKNQGRGLFMAGPITPTLDGLSFINGNATGLGGATFGYDAGGNVAIYRSAPFIRNCRFVKGVAWLGGGLWLGQGKAAIDANYLISNTAAMGGGFLAGASSGSLTGNLFVGNVAGSTGGGLQIMYSDMTLVNNVVMRNHTRGDASGIGVGGSTATFLHTTVAGNTGGDGSGFTINEFLSVPSQAVMTNTILVNQSVGITVGVGSQVQMDRVLLFGNGVNSGGRGVITMTETFGGNPAFAADGYHLTDASAAIDRASDVGVAFDIDRELRPLGRAPDLGADEHPPHRLFLPLILR